MSYLKANYRNSASCCDDFISGINYLEERSISKAVYRFSRAYLCIADNDVNKMKYASYYGLARVLCGDKGGLALCHYASQHEKKDGDVFLNLARAEYVYKNRKQAIDAIQQGLKLDHQHMGLLLMSEMLGVRQRSAVPFLSRSHLLNRVVGRLMRRRSQK
ncbi:MAG: hypothetical protein OEY89_14475 [Gammaproteobacteria bacterium]|nr:hypothetical protein [Gammaproteobacteria bacterium]